MAASSWKDAEAEDDSDCDDLTDMARGKQPVRRRAPKPQPASLAPGPSAPVDESDADLPPHLFPEGDREILAVRDPRRGTMYRRIFCTQLGQLYGACRKCGSNSIPIADFAPKECLYNVRKRPEFLQLIEEFEGAYDKGGIKTARAARQALVRLRSDRCSTCTSTRKLSPNQQACKDLYEAMRQEACKRQDGCLNKDCVERGPRAVHVLEGDHVDPNTKVCSLSMYTRWPGLGGVPAMKHEATKLQWICRFCHKLEPTNSAARRCIDPKLMPEGKRTGTREQVTQYFSKKNAVLKFPKHQYVDEEKLRRGCCMRCERPVTSDNVVGFDFDHRDESMKMRGKGTFAGTHGGVSGIINKVSRGFATLDKIKDVLDAEIAKCDLLCANCHHRKTWGYR